MAEETPTEPHAAFWAARAAHCESVKQKLEAVLAEIEDGHTQGLFQDGITQRLENVRLAVIHHVSTLSVPSGQTTLPPPSGPVSNPPQT